MSEGSIDEGGCIKNDAIDLLRSKLSELETNRNYWMEVSKGLQTNLKRLEEEKNTLRANLKDAVEALSLFELTQAECRKIKEILQRLKEGM